MIAVIQRVKSASVSVGGVGGASIGSGLLVLLGVTKVDTGEVAKRLAKQIANLRIMVDDEGKMNKSLLDSGGELLVVSQFTLLADTTAGRRPSFIEAAKPKIAKKLYEQFIDDAKMLGITTKSGVFGEYMNVELVNDGPVTIILDTAKAS